MEWQQIIGFYYVAKLGSFTKAARKTFRTQSALSQQVKALENEMECELFDRVGKRKLKLTEAGEIFFRFAEAVLQEYNYLTGEINELKRVPKGHLTLAAPYTTLYHLLPSVVQSYVRKFPRVELTILDRPQEAVIRLVREGDVDIGLALESEVPKDIAAVRWRKVETVLMTPLGHPLSKQKEISLHQIAEYPLILPPKGIRYACRTKLEESFQKLAIDYRIIMESSNVELSSLYVEMGMGISFATIVRDLPALKKRRLEFLPMDRLFKSDYIVLAFKKGRQLQSYKQEFIESLLREQSR